MSGRAMARSFLDVAGGILRRHYHAPRNARALATELVPFERSTLMVIGDFLHITTLEARRIYLRSLNAFAEFTLDYEHVCRSGLDYMQERIHGIAIQNLENIRPYLNSRRPLLIVTIHMGMFPLGFLRLVSQIETTREIFVFKMSEQNAHELALFAAFERNAIVPRALRPGEGGGRRAFMELRRGNVVVMSVDLELNVTTRTAVRFLGRNAMMQTGPATLAALTGATVLPVVNFRNASGQAVLRIEAPISSEPLCEGEPHDEVVRRITQSIASIIDSWIRIAPEQVHAWTCLAETALCPASSSVAAAA